MVRYKDIVSNIRKSDCLKNDTPLQRLYRVQLSLIQTSNIVNIIDFIILPEILSSLHNHHQKFTRKFHTIN